MAWMILGPLLPGSQKLDGPLSKFWNDYGCYVVPLSVLELDLAAKRRNSRGGRLAMAGGLALLTLVTAVGIVGAIEVLWGSLLKAAR